MIPRNICEQVLSRAMSTGADYAELFAQYTVDHSIHSISAG